MDVKGKKETSMQNVINVKILRAILLHNIQTHTDTHGLCDNGEKNRRDLLQHIVTLIINALKDLTASAAPHLFESKFEPCVCMCVRSLSKKDVISAIFLLLFLLNH